MVVKEAEILRLENLTVWAGRVPLIQDFEMTLSSGELLALLGPSGSGKTTLLRSIAGLVDPKSGSVLFHGKNPSEIGWPEYRRSVTYIDQYPVLFKDTVRENLERPFKYAVTKEDFPIDLATDLLKRLNLNSGIMDKNAADLSGGEQQRICLIRALLTGPKVLLLDEPTGSLDEHSEGTVEDLLREEARQRGMAAVVVTHDKRLADRLCDRTIDIVPYMTHGTARNFEEF
jgi:ABC-type iron transport system FetAB ATPase subunit